MVSEITSHIVIIQTHFATAFERTLGDQWSTYQAAFGPSAQCRIDSYGYVDQAAFWQRLQRLRAGDRGSDLLYIVRTVLLETWLRTLDLPRERLVRYDSLWTGAPARIEVVGETAA